MGSQPFSAPYSVGRSQHRPESHLPPHVGNLQLRSSASNHSLAELEIAAGSNQPAGILVEMTQIRNVNSGPSSLFYRVPGSACPDFPDDLCYIPEKQILPYALINASVHL